MLSQNPYIEFQLDVSLEQRLLRTHPNTCTEYLSGGGQVQSPDLELGEQKPQLGEGKDFVGNELDNRLVYLSSSLIVLRKLSLRITRLTTDLNTLASISSNNA